jgi:putative DNA methylase
LPLFFPACVQFEKQYKTKGIELMTDDKRLIEDYLPIEKLSEEALAENKRRTAHIKIMHQWWARRPLVAARAAAFGALVSADRFQPQNGPQEKRGSLGRANAAKFLERLCQHPISPQAVADAQAHILSCHAERLSHELAQPTTVEDIQQGRAPRPKVLDLFAGGGAIPLEALRLGCDAFALDLNPVAHVIQLCTLVYPQAYGRPDSKLRGMAGEKDTNAQTTWGGLAAEVQYWGSWVLKTVKTQISDLYPLIPDPQTKGMSLGIPQDFWQHSEVDEVPAGYLAPIAYLWSRVVRCKNPACQSDVPLVRLTWLRKKEGNYVALRVVAPPGKKRASFEIVYARSPSGLGFNPETGSEAGNATCPFCGSVVDSGYVKAEGMAGRLRHQLMAVAAVSGTRRGKQFISAEAAEHHLPSETDI